MLDFTSALYLGLQHSSASLRPWAQLTTGKPAALGVPANEERVSQALATLQGCDRAILGPSTLHLFWDLFGVLAEPGTAIYLDAGTYPIARWGVERAAARAIPVRRFRHHDPEALRWRLRQDASRRLRPVVVADGFCPGCGKVAPIIEYRESVREMAGYLVLDDTQALGILGRSPRPQAPYGSGGGGSLPWAGAPDRNVIIVSSLAKGFGVPVAVLAGGDEIVGRFVAKSKTRMHTSPPSAAVVHAAERALAINHRHGEALRARLADRVRRLRAELTDHGLTASGRLFPVQTLRLGPSIHSSLVHARLLRLGLRTVLQTARAGRDACVLIVTARHRMSDIGQAAEAIATVLRKAHPRSLLEENSHGRLEAELGAS
jgi:8-amino-7-oxononanoate synthase